MTVKPFAGDVIGDETLPVVVRLSISEDTVCSTLPGGDFNRVYSWPNPDSIDGSLFVDFLTEVVDAISDKDTERFLELIDPSQTLREELERLNRKRKRWFDDDKTCSLRVREECSNFRSIGDLISIFPSEGSVSITSVDVFVNNVFDPSGKLRRRISQYISIAADNASCEEEYEAEIAGENEESQDICEEDTYSADEEEEIDKAEEANPENPCYYPSQIEMATILKKRIDTIMSHYYDIAKLSDFFDDVEFAVYTARYRMLSDQTEKRICHPNAGVLSKEQLKSRKESNEEKRMFMYVYSADTKKHFEKLRKDVLEKSKTLFIIIADECHWGITKSVGDNEEKLSAHNLFINEWCKDSPKNVVVVQISATPFNLLTQNSRLPEVSCLLLYDKVTTPRNNHYEAGDLLVLDREPELEEHVKQTSKEVELHVVHWSEVELKNFERGIRMKLKSALITEDAPFKYLHVSSQGQLGVVDDEDKATDFLVQGSHGIVTIKDISSRPQVCALTRDTNGLLEVKVDPPQPARFEVKLEFGVGVVAFSSCDERDHYLAVDDQGHVSLQTAKIDTKCGVSIMKPKHKVTRVSFEFYIDQCRPAEVEVVEKQYMSLNYYLSTMNCHDKNDQKIREDESFQRLVDKSKRQKKQSKTDLSDFNTDALLCAEYCYYVLHIGTYNSDDKIRQVLVSSTEESPAGQFSKKLCSFTEELKEKTRIKKKNTEYIPHEAFEFFRREICNEVKEKFKEEVKYFQKQKKTNNEVHSKEELEDAFVACLMHLSQEDLRKTITEVSNKNGILEDIRTSLQTNNCQKLIENWRYNIQKYETGFLVKNLIESGKGDTGKMKIVRAKTKETANMFFYTLELARELSSLKECFEIIRDYGGEQIEKQLKPSSPFFSKLQPVNCQFKLDCRCSELELCPGRRKCTNCQHVHKSITQYEDLEDLACVLILVDKGRMGDTFPQSFDCLDLRLSYDNSLEFYLSTVIQELGRMCRYSKVSFRGTYVQHIPYVLIGRKLFKTLAESAQRSPAMSAISRIRPDRYMSNSKSKSKKSAPLRWLDYEAHKDSYDYGNEQEHCNRILLQAEPQIGKTGTYLCLIKTLRLDILNAFEEGSFYIYKHCDSVEDSMDGSVNNDEDWQYPYWKTIENSPSLLEKAVGQGKYSIGGLFYTHDIEDNPFILMEREQQRPVKSNLNYQKRDCADGIRSWHWYHFENCVECGRLLQGELPDLEALEVNIDGTPVTVACSLPTNGLPYNYLREHLRSIRSGEGSWTEFNRPGVTSLSYWIFHPSHRDDPRKCLLNYHHVMQEENQVARYLQVAVVRSEMFQAYKSTWGKVLAIFQLPDELPNCELGPSEGGVGYARLFIQRIAFALGLEYVFVIDDNVALMSEAVFRSDEGTTTGQSVVRDENGVMKMERCSFLKPLTYLQKIASGKGNPPDERIQYEPHPLKNQPEGQQFPLYTYTGPAKLFGDSPFKSYGILGLLRSVPKSVKPFTKTQVYAAVLLNVKSTVEKNVFYRPWPCWEDLRFNDDCDQADLWVVKCNRFLFHKVQYNDWINDLALPSIFKWKRESTLENRPVSSELPWVSEEGIILEHLLKIVKGPGECLQGRIGYDRPGDDEDQLCPTRIVERLDLQLNERKEDGSFSKIPILIMPYSVADRRFNIMMDLNSAFCAAQQRIIFITSAKDVMEKWPRLTLSTISSPNGICFFEEMTKRDGQFSIFSAADPRRHRLRWIVIEASFLKEDDLMLGYQEQSSEESIRTSEEVSLSTKSQETVVVRRSSQTPFNTEPGLEESFSANRSSQEISGEKKSFQDTLDEETIRRDSFQGIPGIKSSRQESPSAKLGTIQDSSSKRRTMGDSFGQKNDQKHDKKSVEKTVENEGTGAETSSGQKVKRRKISVADSVERSSKSDEQGEATLENEKSKVRKKKKKELKTESNHESTKPFRPGQSQDNVLRSRDDVQMASTSSLHGKRDASVVKEEGGETSSSKKVKQKKYAAEERGECNRKGSGKGEAISKNKQSKVSKQRKKELKTESSQRSTTPTLSIEGQEIISKNEDDKQRTSTSSLHNEDDENESNAKGQTNMNSMYSRQWEGTESYSEDDVESNDNSNTSHLSGKNSSPRLQDADTIPVYNAGTNEVTAVIVNLWTEHKRRKREEKMDLPKDFVQNSLGNFKKDALETNDKQGYNALLKACSLPAMSPHVMQHLIVDRMVDLNCRLPDDFDKHHPSAKGLIPGMSALSVAIRRQNTSCISTFKRREKEISVQDADKEGNTALHHCVVSGSKGAFEKLFPLYELLNWKQMFNSEKNSPLDIARNLAQENTAIKKPALGHILGKMEGNTPSDVLRYIAIDCSEIDCEQFLFSRSFSGLAGLERAN